ncbi:MAG: glycoside hydrolase family 3 protein, partial [Lachnospiraceae bacterium]|nr:glycoside hydrolase family 3 protein [Lachnospiraceae bacterium]
EVETFEQEMAKQLDTEPEEEELDVEEILSQAEEVISEDIVPMEDPEVSAAISVMNNEQKIAQLFMVTPEALTGVDVATAAGNATKESFEKRQVGGIVYFGKNIVDPTQTAEMLTNMQNIALSVNSLPIFLGVDEEGGDITRVSSNPAFSVTSVACAEELAKDGDENAAYEGGAIIGKYLNELGFNLDFAPVADVKENEDSDIGNRSFGTDADTVAKMSTSYAKGLMDNGVLSCFKHFPAYGRAGANTDTNTVSVNTPLEDIKSTDMKPYEAAISEKIPLIMAGNVIIEGVGEANTPVCMQPDLINSYLKEECGYEGIVITDALNAASIKDNYTSGEACVKAIKAGVDMILMPDDFEEAFTAVLNAYEAGEIDNERIEDALTRILKVKLDMQKNMNRAEESTSDNSAEAEEE